MTRSCISNINIVQHVNFYEDYLLFTLKMLLCNLRDVWFDKELKDKKIFF